MVATANAVFNYALRKAHGTRPVPWLPAYGLFFRALLQRGVYFPPSQYEAAFVSTSHSEGDIHDTVEAAAMAFASLRS